MKTDTAKRRPANPPDNRLTLQPDSAVGRPVGDVAYMRMPLSLGAMASLEKFIGSAYGKDCVCTEDPKGWLKVSAPNTAKPGDCRPVPSVVGRLVVIQSEDLKDPMTEVPETASIDGTFDTMERVEQFIRADTHEFFPPDAGREGRNDDRTAPIYICQVIRVVKAVPIISMKVMVEDAVPTPNPAGQGMTHETARKD